MMLYEDWQQAQGGRREIMGEGFSGLCRLSAHVHTFFLKASYYTFFFIFFFLVQSLFCSVVPLINSYHEQSIFP